MDEGFVFGVGEFGLDFLWGEPECDGVVGVGGGEVEGRGGVGEESEFFEFKGILATGFADFVAGVGAEFAEIGEGGDAGFFGDFSAGCVLRGFVGFEMAFGEGPAAVALVHDENVALGANDDAAGGVRICGFHDAFKSYHRCLIRASLVVDWKSVYFRGVDGTMSTELIDQLSEMSFDVIDRELSVAELGVLVEGLRSPDPVAYRQAVIVFSFLSKDAVLVVLDQFALIPISMRKMMSIFMSAMEFYQPFELMLRELHETTDADYAEVLIQCLGRSPYMFLPLLMDYLGEKDPLILSRFKQVLQLLGVSAIQLYIEMVPVLPYEVVFREVFGDEVIDGLRRLPQ